MPKLPDLEVFVANFKESVMENLNFLLLNRFDEILEVISSPWEVSYDIYVRTGVIVPAFVKKLNEYLLEYLQANRMNMEFIYFNMYQHGTLMNAQLISHKE